MVRQIRKPDFPQALLGGLQELNGCSSKKANRPNRPMFDFIRPILRSKLRLGESTEPEVRH